MTTTTSCAGSSLGPRSLTADPGPCVSEAAGAVDVSGLAAGARFIYVTQEQALLGHEACRPAALPPYNGAADALHALARGAISAKGARGPALASLACLSAPCGSRSCGARQWKSSTDAAASAARAGGRGMTGGCARGRTSEPGRHRGGAAARRRRRSSDATRSAQSLNRMARWSSTSNAASRTAVSRPSPARAAAHPSVRLQLCALPRSST